MPYVTIDEITRLQTARNAIRTKFVEFGISTSSDLLDAIANAATNIPNNGTVNAEVKEGESYTIKRGWHNGGTVLGVAGGGNYNLQTKGPITPTKQTQTIAPDDGFYGLSSVNIGAIPDNYNDTSSVNALAADVLANKIIVGADGSTIAGTMPNLGKVTKVLDATTTSFSISKGYHNGEGSVSVSLETKTITPTESKQTITPTAGKLISSFIVERIPEEYIVTTDATAVESQILAGNTAYVDGVKLEGTMPNIGNVTKVLDATTTNFGIALGYHDGTGNVSVVLETKSVTPTKAEQTINATTGKLMSKVTVAAIPEEYITTTDATATAAQIIAGETAYVNGIKVEGTMANNGDVADSMDGLTVTSIVIPAGFTSGGTISLDNSIAEALAAI